MKNSINVKCSFILNEFIWENIFNIWNFKIWLVLLSYSLYLVLSFRKMVILIELQEENMIIFDVIIFLNFFLIIYIFFINDIFLLILREKITCYRFNQFCIFVFINVFTFYNSFSVYVFINVFCIFGKKLYVFSIILLVCYNYI